MTARKQSDATALRQAKIELTRRMKILRERDIDAVFYRDKAERLEKELAVLNVRFDKLLERTPVDKAKE